MTLKAGGFRFWSRRAARTLLGSVRRLVADAADTVVRDRRLVL
jgi:hypothetical protein